MSRENIIKVLIVSHSYIVAENQKNIDAFSDQVTPLVIVPNKNSDSIHGEIEADKHPDVLILPRVSMGGVQYFLRSIDLNLREFKADIIHVEYDPWSLIFWQVCLIKAVFAREAKLICTVKNNTYNDYPGIKGWVKRNIAHFFVKRCDFFIAVNQGVWNIYHKKFKVDDSKLTVMQHLGVDSQLFKPNLDLKVKTDEKTEANLNIGFCGRFDEEKGIDDLINALIPISKKNSNLKLLLLGSGAKKEELLSQSLPWVEIRNRVPHDQVASFMRELDIFVLPSRVSKTHEEHDAHVLLEAMSCGVSTIGSSSGIIPEVLDGDAGLLYEAGNVTDLKMKLELFISSAELRKSYAETGLSKISQNYSVIALAKEKQRVYKKILKESI